MISRFIEKQILKSIEPGKVIGLFGPRRTGKTILMTKIKEELKDKLILMVSGENLDAAESLSSQRISILKKFIGSYRYLFIDEAQKIPNIGVNLKLITDHLPQVSVFVSGSSSFDLRYQIGEPLVGRSRFFYLYPIAQLELENQEDYLKTKENLENRLVFGSYPQVITAETNEQKIEVLESIRDGFLLKDILELDNLKDSLFVFNLLRLLAFQIGNDISYSELASNLNVNKKTVMRYIELLEKTYVIFSLRGFSRNLRKEYTKSPRIYFWDNGIRNAVIANFNSLNFRDDIGRLWENYCVSERLKKARYQNIRANRYFWRTYDQQEIDLVEEREGRLFGYEIKWKDGKTKPPKAFLAAYPDSEFQLITRENYLEFIA